MVQLGFGATFWQGRFVEHVSIPWVPMFIQDAALKASKAAGLFRGFVGDEILPSDVGIIIKHEIRIPITQPGFNGILERRAGFFSWLHLGISWKKQTPPRMQSAQGFQ